MKKIFITLSIILFSSSAFAEQISMIERFGLEIDKSCPQISLSVKNCSKYSCITENPIFSGLRIRHSVNDNIDSKICEYKVENFAVDEGEENIYHKVTCDLDSKEAQSLINSIQGKKFKEWGIDFQYMVNFYNKYCFTDA